MYYRKSEQSLYYLNKYRLALNKVLSRLRCIGYRAQNVTWLTLVKPAGLWIFEKKGHFRALRNVDPSTSTVAEHALQNGHDIAWSDAQVLASNSCSTQRYAIKVLGTSDPNPDLWIQRLVVCLLFMILSFVHHDVGLYCLCMSSVTFTTIGIHLSIYFCFWLVYPFCSLKCAFLRTF